MQAAWIVVLRRGCNSFVVLLHARCWPSNLEARLATGEPIDIAEHAQLTSSMVRVAQRIGINRRLKEVVPTLSQYLAKADDEEEVAE